MKQFEATVPHGNQGGVTLIELMVGMLLGLVAVILISQVLLNSESQKRTSTGGSDAQVNAALALYAIQRDVQMAGYGLTSSPQLVGCPINARFNNAVPALFPTMLAPVFITPQASRPPGSVGDSIRVLASSKPSYAIPTRVIPPGYAVGGTGFPVRASLGFASGDLALVGTNATAPCWVFQLAGTVTPRNVPRANDAAGWNPANAPDVPYGDGAILVNLGALLDNIYEVNDGVLQISTLGAANPGVRAVSDVQSDIVTMRAFYGRDTTAVADGVVDVYDVPNVAAYTNEDWRRVLAVRVAIVARSSTWEREQVTPTNPQWSVGSLPVVAGAVDCATGGGKCLTIDVGAGVDGDVEAKHYRYKFFDTVIPLRNMLWSSQ
jgi:type IV pilus assembly protein PilW